MSATTKGKIHTLLQGNRLVEARKLCESLCRKSKSDAEAWFLLGSVYGQTGEPDKAINCLRRSIAIQGNIAITHYNLGLTNLRLGRFTEARASFEKALSLDPGLTAARHDLANAIQSGGCPEDSIPHYLMALEAAPGIPAILMNLASAYESCSQTKPAIEALQKSLQLEPANIDAHFRLGNLLHKTSDYAGAIQHFRFILDRQPDFLEALVNLGNAQLKLESSEDAIASYRKALALKGDSADILFNLGNALRMEGLLDEAEAAYRKALEYRPDMPLALNNLGLVFHERYAYTEAETCYLQSLQSNKRQTEAYINLAKCYREQRQPERAIDTLQRALSMFPDSPEIHWDYSLLLLETGRFTAGWKEYEWRWLGEGQPRREFPWPEWRGEPLEDRTVLVYAEQGIGDEIMFSSCLPDMIKAAGHVIIDCDPRLAPVFERSFPETTVHPGTQSAGFSPLSMIPPPEFVVPAGSLPRYFRGTLQDFPQQPGYLLADRAAIERWCRRYAAHNSKIAVGLSWKGGHISQAARRSTTLQDWQGIISVPGICFVNLQYGDIRAEIDQANQSNSNHIHHWDDADPLRDMDNLAAQIAALDLVISVDNSTVHLAGALGIDTWVLQSYVPDWRWMNHARNSYWYPSIRQFHQSAPGQWSDLLQNVRTRLEVLVDS
jgi:tetratricopeptide (TPR) repeat protein